MPRKPRDKTPAKANAPRKKAAPKKPEKSAAPAVPAAPAAPVRESPPAKPVYAHYFDDPAKVKSAIYALFAVCGITFLLDFVVHRHVDHPWESFFGFYAVYGFVACVLLVLAAREMRKLLMRKDDYYDE
ncbi:MAG TPA: hypothetical protein VGA19_06525 [Rhodospirillales bacterium]|jgi:hypothetical protein